jgi:hypothetical protein
MATLRLSLHSAQGSINLFGTLVLLQELKERITELERAAKKVPKELKRTGFFSGNGSECKRGRPERPEDAWRSMS